MCSILISGYYGFDNAGDEAILQSLVTELKRAYSDIDIVVLSANPEKTAHDFGIRAVNRSNVIQIVRSIRKCNILISGGGSLFQDTTSIFNMWYYGSIIMMAIMMKKQVFAFAQGIGPVNSSINKKLLKCIMNRVQNVSVRDKRSLEQLKKIGVNRKISCTIDPAFLNTCISREESLELLKAESRGIDFHKPLIGFSIRNWKGNVDIAGIFADVGDRITRELGVGVVFFPLHYEKDIIVADEIASKMKEKPIIIRGNYSPSQLMGLYGLMSMNVSIRFHGLVFSLLHNVPVVAISYDPKIDSLMDFAGINNVLKYDELNAQSVFNAIKSKWNSKNEISRYLEGRTEEFKKLARAGIDEVVEAVRNIKKNA